MAKPMHSTASPAEVMAVFREIFVALEQKAFDQAEKLMAATGIDKSAAPQALYAQALLAYGRGDARLAKVKFSRAAKAAPTFALPLIGLGNACLALHETDAALKAYRAALAIEPANPAILSNIGGTERLAGRLAEAEATLTEALALAPDNAAAMLNLAQTKAAQGDVAAALAVLEPLGDAADAVALRARLADGGAVA